MNVRIFNKKYWVRQFSSSDVYKGYVVSTHTDKTFSLNVHPLGAEQMKALPEGERNIAKLEAHGDAGIVPADKSAGKRGDLLYYGGEWYECTSAVVWDHTILSHTNYQFSILPKDDPGVDILNPPQSDPN